jgi:two-component system NtrC family sensor kinase
VSAPAVHAGAPGVAAQLLEAKQWVRSADDGAVSAEFVGTEPARVPAAAERVLIADDNADMREYLGRLVSPYWHTTLVPDGRAALESALAAPPDLVLSDVMMPEMDGVALLAALRADDRTKTIPVILLSARAGEEARLTGLETGADDYLVKPFSAREVVTRVRTHLEMARVRREAFDALRRTQSQLIQSAKLASLGELVAGVAHEVNNPLAFVISHLDTIQRSLARVEQEVAGRLPNETASQWQRALTRLPQLSGGLTRIQELVLKLRTFARLDEGERKLISVRQSIDSVLVIVGHRLGTRITVSMELNAPDRIDCFAGLFNQVLMNLITNAIDAIADKGTIAIKSDLRNGQFELSVADTGCGISESVRARVFDPFFTTKPVGQGTGLGLSIAHSIAVKHGGELELSARDGGGTLATLRFPLRAVP